VTPDETAAAAKGPVGDLGMRFMATPQTRETGRAAGLRSKPFYHRGRGGVLGEVDADVVRAAFVFFPAGVVRTSWETGRDALGAAETAALYAGCCADWGRTAMAGFAGAGRLAELLEKVIDGAESAGLPVFAGWRALPRPDDAPARLALHLMTARELRGGQHGVAVVAEGLEPLQAVLAGPYGAGNATFFDWPEPYPDPAPWRDAWARAEQTTARLSAVAYGVLPEDERAELITLLEQAQAAVSA
jgi:hypothetical protein